MDFFNCESCNKVTHFEATFSSITSAYEKTTFMIKGRKTPYTTNNDCICIPCGKKHHAPMLFNNGFNVTVSEGPKSNYYWVASE